MSDRLHELTQEIDEVRAAIRAAVQGTTFSIGGRSVSRQELPSLRNHLTYLLRERSRLEIEAAGYTDGGAQVAFPRAGRT